MNEARTGTLEQVDIRIEQARQLKDRIVQSCMFVEMVILYIFIMLFLGGYQTDAYVWFFSASLMVAATFIYSKLMARSGITKENVNRYLIGHVVLSSLTGAIWGVLAMYFVDWDSAFSLFVASTIVCMVVLGGMMPGAAYRPGFIGLATFMLIPFAIYVVLFAQGSFRLAGFGILILYVFGMVSNLQAQRNSHDGMYARQLSDLNSKIRQQNEVIRKVNEEKTRFLAATSHDFSQPLHAQGYFIQSLGAMLKDEAQMALLEKIETSWRHQKRLLQGLVEINRLDSGTIIPKKRSIDLKSRMQDLVDEFEESAANKSIEFKTDISAVNVNTDPLLLSRIVQNLISNAIRYTPEGGLVSLVVSVIISDDQEFAEIKVSDNGAGIPKDQHNRIFEEYVQIHETSPDQEIGMGLGLSIVKRLSELLDLDLSLESARDKGTRFTLTIPTDKNTIPEETKTIKSQGNEASKAAPLIILVDDEKAIRQSMSVLLSDWGYQLITAEGPSEAIELLSGTDVTPALLIIDKRLANGQSGIDLIRDLREEVNQETPAILMSGDLKTKLEDIGEPINHFLSKPIEPDHIRRVIAETLTA
jgi:signal transduction histidine kinase/ActR/RegA family two-component response regulator